MRHVSQMLEPMQHGRFLKPVSPSRNTEPTKGNQNTIDIPEWVTELFARFTSIYKSRWVNDMQEPAEVIASMQEWATDPNLQGITDAELDAAIEYCKCNVSDWPPGHFKFGEVLRLVRKEMERQKERESLKSRLPPPPDEITQWLAQGAELAKRIKQANPHLTWQEIGKIMRRKNNA